jgi:GDP-D-mannose dehydratase
MSSRMGYAKGYLDAIWRMLEQDRPDGYVIATGEVRSVQSLSRKHPWTSDGLAQMCEERSQILPSCEVDFSHE